jgi:hypothetical protein
VIESVPTGSDVVLNVAIPAAFRVPVPRMVDPFVKVTTPVGVVAPDCGETLAVKVTLCPVLIAVAEALNAVVVATRVCVTVTATGAETELEFVVLPAYDAVIDCVPAAREVVLKEAAPLPLSVAVPSAVVPSMKVTVPVGVVVPDAGETMAVNVTLWPVLICVAEAVNAVVVATKVCVTLTVTAVETELELVVLPP